MGYGIPRPGREEREGVSAGDRPTFTIAYDSPTFLTTTLRTVQCRSPSTLPLRRRPRRHLMFSVAPPARGSPIAIPITITMTKEPCQGPYLRTSLSFSSPLSIQPRLGGRVVSI